MTKYSQVHLWGASLIRLTPANIQALASLCNTHEQQRAAKFMRERDRQAYFASHGILRLALSQIQPTIAPTQWAFTIDPHQRPEITNATPQRLRFNLSHCATRVVCVVCYDWDCGIDVESGQRSADIEMLIQRCLSTDELDWLQGQSATQRRSAFMRFWTLKEALAKALGVGLSLPFAQLTFRLGDPPQLLAAPPEYPDQNWWLEQNITEDGHCEALAIHASSSQDIQLIRHEWPDFQFLLA